MKNTPFYKNHMALGAKMAPFAGFNMPISYKSINEEHATVRNNAGVFDVSHMGEFIVKGDHALELLQRLTSNNIAALTAGKAQYSCLTNDQGKIIDDLIVYCITQNDTYMLVVNAANIEKNWTWINNQNKHNATIKNISDVTCLLAIQGPNATKILQPLTEVNILDLPHYTFTKGSFAGIDNVLISATGYTGAGGVEIYFEDNNNAANMIWNAIFKTGMPYGLAPIGLAARDTLRLEMGYCLYGNDIDDTTNMWEAGLGWITKFTKPFVGSAALQQKKIQGIQQKLIGFEMIEKGIPRQHYTITNTEGKPIGRVTSGTQSPTLGKGIGLGYVSVENSQPNTDICINIRNKNVKAKVIKPPFV